MLSASSQQVALELGVVPLIQQLNDLHQQKSADPALELERLRLKQQLTDSVLIGTLQVRDVTARIDRQISLLNRVRGLLEDRRDRAIRLNTLANIFGMGLVNEYGQAGEIPKNELPGEIAELVAGGITMALSGIALRQQSGGRISGRPKPNMLAKVFGCPTDQETEYPPLVWNYLNADPDGSGPGQSRINELLGRWQRYKIIGGTKSARDKDQIALLTNTSRSLQVNISLLESQTALLTDLRSEIFQLDRALLDLLVTTQAL